MNGSGGGCRGVLNSGERESEREKGPRVCAFVVAFGGFC